MFTLLSYPSQDHGYFIWNTLTSLVQAQSGHKMLQSTTEWEKWQANGCFKVYFPSCIIYITWGSFRSQDKANLIMNSYGQSDTEQQKRPQTKQDSLHCFKVPLRCRIRNIHLLFFIQHSQVTWNFSLSLPRIAQFPTKSPPL